MKDKLFGLSDQYVTKRVVRTLGLKSKQLITNVNSLLLRTNVNLLKMQIMNTDEASVQFIEQLKLDSCIILFSACLPCISFLLTKFLFI